MKMKYLDAAEIRSRVAAALDKSKVCPGATTKQVDAFMVTLLLGHDLGIVESARIIGKGNETE